MVNPVNEIATADGADRIRKSPHTGGRSDRGLLSPEGGSSLGRGVLVRATCPGEASAKTKESVDGSPMPLLTTKKKLSTDGATGGTDAYPHHDFCRPLLDSNIDILSAAGAFTPGY